VVLPVKSLDVKTRHLRLKKKRRRIYGPHFPLPPVPSRIRETPLESIKSNLDLFTSCV
jgi:hypothetical protein